MAELKPCPFCGGRGKINAKQSGFFGENCFGNKKIGWTVYVKCTKCHSRGKPIKTDPIKLYAGDRAGGAQYSFYTTSYWVGASRGFEGATKTFEPYATQAIEAWNRRCE